MANNNVPEEKLLEALNKQREMLNKLIALTERARTEKEHIIALMAAGENAVDAYARYQEVRHKMVDAYLDVKDGIEDNVIGAFHEYAYHDCGSTSDSESAPATNDRPDPKKRR